MRSLLTRSGRSTPSPSPRAERDESCVVPPLGSGRPRPRSFLFVATLLLGTLPPLASLAGIVIRVPDDELTIEAGLGIATYGDTVRVDCNTYFESGLILPDGVTLEAAAYDSGCVVIDGDGRATILSCLSNTSGTVRNITFRDGSGTTGGAVYCSNATVTFDCCLFRYNESPTGGAIYWADGAPDIVGCTFSNNTATNSGGGMALFQTDGTVVGCRFEYNVALAGGGVFASLLGTTTAFTECEFYTNMASTPTLGGGGVFCGTQVEPTFLHCRFDNNEADYGGAVHNSIKADPSFVGCEFEYNDATTYGGAVYGYDDYASFDQCEFTHNEATLGSGGGLYLDKSDITMDFCTLYMNEAIAGGGVMGMNEATLDIESCTIVENAVDERAVGGAGMLVGGNAVATIDQTIIAFNRGGEGLKCDTGGTATLTCTDVAGNDGGNWIGCIAGQQALNGNLDVGPRICNIPAYYLYLCANSPCLATLNDCGELIGAWDEGCAECDSPVESVSWGTLKGMYR